MHEPWPSSEEGCVTPAINPRISLELLVAPLAWVLAGHENRRIGTYGRLVPQGKLAETMDDGLALASKLDKQIKVVTTTVMVMMRRR